MMAELATDPGLHGLMAEFDNADALLAASKKTYAAGYRRLDAFSPFPVHGLSEAVGYRKRLLPWLVLAGGILGVGLCYLATLSLANQVVMYFQGFALPLWGVPVCLTAAVSIGVLSSLPPAAIAVRMTITEALRHGE